MHEPIQTTSSTLVPWVINCKQHWVFVHGLPHHFPFRLMYSILLRTLSKEEKRLQNLLDWDNTDSPMLIGAKQKGLKFATVAECMGDPGGAYTTPAPTTGATSC
jgi:hypothetical protein